MNGPNKPEVLSLSNLSDIVLSNGVAFWAIHKVRIKMKCCEYGTWPLLYTDFTPVNPEKSFIALVPGFSQGKTSRESLKSSNDEETLVTRIKKWVRVN